LQQRLYLRGGAGLDNKITEALSKLETQQRQISNLENQNRTLDNVQYIQSDQIKRLQYDFSELKIEYRALKDLNEQLRTENSVFCLLSSDPCLPTPASFSTIH
jgi:hypothetical protein